jgi:hypothetical protein
MSQEIYLVMTEGTACTIGQLDVVRDYIMIVSTCAEKPKGSEKMV